MQTNLKFRHQIFTLLLILPSIIFGQSSLKMAEKYFEQGEYVLALQHYDVVAISKNKKALANRGIAQFHTNNLTKASIDLTKAFELGNDDPILKYYMGKINHQKRNYSEAIYFYKEYLKAQKAEEALNKDVALKIDHCFSGLKKKYDSETVGFVEMVDSDINTMYDEVNPSFSPNNDSRLYYSTNHGGHYDLQSAQMGINKWEHVKAIHTGLNTGDDEILQDFSQDGSIMMFLRGDADETNNRVYLNRYAESKHSQRVLFSEVKAVSGDKDVYLVNDKLMIFSSKRSGGYGGYDLYISEFKSNGWSSPKNLGPEVNSAYDEVAGFMTEDQANLFFSSDRPSSIGGYDIFKTVKKDDKWTKPVNPDYPLNSPGNDMNFRMQQSGNQAIFASDRKTGVGGYDLYVSMMKMPYVVNTSDPKQPLSLIRSSVKDEDYASGTIDEELVVEEPIFTKEEIEEVPASDEVEEVVVEEVVPELEEEMVEELAEEIEEKEASVSDEVEEVVAEEVVPELEEETVEELTEEVKEKEVPVSNEAVEVVEELEEELVEEITEEIKPVEQIEDTKTEVVEEIVEQPVKERKTVKEVKEEEKKPVGELTVLNSLVYQNEDLILDENNLMVMDKLILTMNKYPQSKVILTCHSLPEGLPEFELNFTIKRAERIAQHLISNGISDKRICINSVGSAYPMIRKVNDKELYDEYKVLNNRIDIKMINADPSVVSKAPEVETVLFDPSAEIYKTMVEDVYFRIQVNESEKSMFKNAILRYYSDVFVEKDNSKGVYRHYVGLYPDFKRSFELLRKLENKKIEATMVPFFNGMRLSESDIELLESEYPELTKFKDLSDDATTSTGSSQ